MQDRKGAIQMTWFVLGMTFLAAIVMLSAWAFVDALKEKDYDAD